MLQLDRVSLSEETDQLRSEVRAFLEENKSHFAVPNSDFSSGHDSEFSRKLGDKGWIGMTWPKEYGGGERSFFERYVVTGEILPPASARTGSLTLRSIVIALRYPGPTGGISAPDYSG